MLSFSFVATDISPESFKKKFFLIISLHRLRVNLSRLSTLASQYFIKKTSCARTSIKILLDAE